MIRRVVVVPHDAAWASAFLRASREAVPAFGPNLVELHHIGSTSVPGIHAKPIIDMLAEVSDLAAVDRSGARLEALGYVARGEFGIPGRRFFYRDDPAGNRTHHIHAFASGAPGVARHLAFRDFLIAHPQVASAYSDLKRRLAEAHPEGIEAYMDGKDAFIKDVEAKAQAWVIDPTACPP